MSNQGWRKSREYRLWAARVKRRDKVCQIVGCGRRKTGHAHHIKNASHHPELRYDVANGVRVCARCHWAIHNLVHPSYRYKTGETSLAMWQAVAALLKRLPEKPNFYR